MPQRSTIGSSFGVSKRVSRTSAGSLSCVNGMLNLFRQASASSTVRLADGSHRWQPPILVRASALRNAVRISSPELPARREEDRRRSPIRARRRRRGRSTTRSSPFPEDRSLDTHGPEGQTSKKALSHADQNRALERRARVTDTNFPTALFVGLRERQVCENALSEVRTSGQKKEQRVQQYKEMKGGRRMSALKTTCRPWPTIRAGCQKMSLRQ